MARVVVVGSINTDYVVRVPHFPQPGETQAGRSFANLAGGKGAKQAVAAARAGARVSMAGAIGRDAESRQRRIDLEYAGIDVRNVLQVEGSGGLALIQVHAATGQNSIVIVPGANQAVPPDALAHVLSGAGHAGDVLCCQLEVPLSTVAESLRRAREAGMTTILNAAPFVPSATELLGDVDHLVVNEVEAGQFLDTAPIAVNEARDAGRSLRARGPSVVVMTLGARGALLVSGADDVLVPAPRVDVVDTTGAGDCFVGVYAAEIAAGTIPAEATRIAVVAASISVQRQGAQPSMPSRAEIETRLAAG
jgi:ribokinase